MPLHRAASSVIPMSEASFSRLQSTRTTPFAWKKLVSWASQATDHPSAS